MGVGAMGWYSVRCVFQLIDENDDESPYEERITLWQASDFETAIELAEDEAAEYIEGTTWAYLGLAQCFYLGDDVSTILSGTEVYSLIRTSTLAPDDYLDTFFDTGNEYQRHVEDS
ncbi:DUF4288 domain-containing protein [Kribbella monticola]|uniref:DUF4288 domain-containing protein n=1 Tax=Kribbella monticola TaxID=2185285 RepID=UPI000DD2D89B